MKKIALTIAALAACASLVNLIAETNISADYILNSARRLFNHEAPYSETERQRLNQISGTLAVHGPTMQQRANMNEMVEDYLGTK